MAYRDLRDFIEHLEREGELKRISVEVDPELELCEIADRVSKDIGPALLFEQVKGSAMPVLVNAVGSMRRRVSTHARRSSPASGAVTPRRSRGAALRCPRSRTPAWPSIRTP